jgi:acetyl/propionyl-CoA carboxylase alpha subunit
MSRVARVEDVPAALAEGRRLAEAAFGDGTVYLERLLEGSRHIEIQVFGDSRGNVVSLFERECSVQRRHQKILEETPSVALNDELRRAMGEAAVAAARAVGYVGAGTVEFLFEGGRFYFLEMNTRLQVEHPITEETLGVDLVRAQLDVASGGELPRSWRDGSLRPRGHAIELRLYAEDPVEFLPRSGRILVYREPSGPGIRVDAGVEEGSFVGVDYDPLLAKLVVSAGTRRAAIERARRALGEWVVLGVETNGRLLEAVLASQRFVSGAYTTDLIAQMPPLGGEDPPEAAWIAAALAPSPAAAGGPSGASPGTDPWDAGTSWRAGA